MALVGRTGNQLIISFLCYRCVLTWNFCYILNLMTKVQIFAMTYLFLLCWTTHIDRSQHEYSASEILIYWSSGDFIHFRCKKALSWTEICAIFAYSSLTFGNIYLHIIYVEICKKKYSPRWYRYFCCLTVNFLACAKQLML